MQTIIDIPSWDDYNNHIDRKRGLNTESIAGKGASRYNVRTASGSSETEKTSESEVPVLAFFGETEIVHLHMSK